ncbi:wings apart-like protein regulation of heterochromatin-domain-containing protein [Aspergillus multicolor]|uniref:WAPL family protein n=1 Tax=Aspergillus multicolor TaxID=41759 RepID=UPI003CCDC331
MSENRKRPITYGKLHRNRPDPCVPGSERMTRLSSRTSPNNAYTASVIPPKSSIGQSESKIPAKSSNAPSSQRGNESGVMQRKRRKLIDEGTLLDYSPIQVDSQAPANSNLQDIALHDTDDVRSDTSQCDNRLNNSDAINSSSSDAARPSTHHLQQAEQTRARNFGLQRKDDTTYTRRRLIDSLCAADESHAGSIASNLAASKTHMPPARRGLGVREGDFQPVPTLRSPAVTYSRQRSFLNDPVGVAGKDHLAGPLVDKGGAHSEEDTTDSKPVRSIHELRRAGDNARFREAVDSLFEDIEDPHNTASEKCCGLAELCSKLLDTEFVHRFSEHAFDERLVNCMPHSPDIVSASLALSAYRLIISGGRFSRPFLEASWEQVVELAPRLLDVEDDLHILAREPSVGLFKTAQVSIRSIRSHLLSTISASPTCLSPRLLILECTKSSLIVLRESGHVIRLIPTYLLNKLVDLITSPPSMNRTPLLHLIFSILENYSVISGSFDHDHCRSFERLSQLHHLLCLNNGDHSDATSLSYIRVILNLTNKDPSVCESFASHGLVSGLAKVVIGFNNPSDEAGVNNLNKVILALGTLINLSQDTKQSKDILVQSDGRTSSFLQQLLRQFIGSVSAMDQVSFHFNLRPALTGIGTLRTRNA